MEPLRRIVEGSRVELFGNATSCGTRRCSDGIEALEQHDANHDGAINAADAVYSKLRIWRDDNRNGSCEAGELTSLAEAGIRSISLAARLDLSFVDARGNAATRRLVFERITGARGPMPDVWFSLEFDRLPSDPRSSGIVTTAPRGSSPRSALNAHPRRPQGSVWPQCQPSHCRDTAEPRNSPLRPCLLSARTRGSMLAPLIGVKPIRRSSVTREQRERSQVRHEPPFS